MIATSRQNSSTSTKQVRVQENRDALGFEFVQDVADLFAADGIDAVARFVEHQQLRRMHQRLRQSDALQHAFGILAEPDRTPFVEAHFLHQFGNAGLALRSPTCRRARRRNRASPRRSGKSGKR